jgi:hypothetical protein
VRKKPFARASVFLRLLRRLVPRLTLGTFLSPYISADQARALRTVHARKIKSLLDSRFPRKSAPNLVRQHPPHLGLIGIIGHDTLPEAALAGARLGGQNVTREGMMANHFARTRLFEPLGRTLMGLQLWHKYPFLKRTSRSSLLYD